MRNIRKIDEGAKDMKYTKIEYERDICNIRKLNTKETYAIYEKLKAKEICVLFICERAYRGRIDATTRFFVFVLRRAV